MKAFILVFVSVFSFSSFAADRAEELFNQFNENCAGNGAGSIEKFSLRAVDFSKEMLKLRETTKECSEGRFYSTNKETGASIALNFLWNDEGARICLQENFSESERDGLYDVIRDPSNIAVLAYDGYTGPNPEACYYTQFWVYRASGKVLKFEMDQSD